MSRAISATGRARGSILDKSIKYSIIAPIGARWNVSADLAALPVYRIGGSRPLPELFEAAGCRFAFDRETIKPLVTLVRGELAKLN